MKLFAVALSALAAVTNAQISLGRQSNWLDATVDEVNTNSLNSWTAKSYPEKFPTAQDAIVRLGVDLDMLHSEESFETGLDYVPEVVYEASEGFVAPDSFDARIEWGSAIHPIRDQAQCGSCWAFGAAESLSDRITIATGNATDVVLSPEDLVSCDIFGNMGCNGGIPLLAWAYMEVVGLRSDACDPYKAGEGQASKCRIHCDDPDEDGSFYRVKALTVKEYKGVSAMQEAIMTNGPIEVAFSVYQDFMTYESGVYSHQTGSLLGGHAVKAIGWGTEDGEDYWLIANSWNTDWGLDGYFKIKRGTDECGIEDGGVAGLSKNSY